MRNIVYVAPFPMRTTMRFAKALASLDGIRLLGVFQMGPRPQDAHLFDDVFVVRNTLDVGELLHAVGTLGARHGGIDRVIGILEDAQEPLAEVREHYGLPGERPATAKRFRDKTAMKDALRQAGIPTASHARLTDPAQAWAFVKKNGFPVVLKPASGSGCRSTYRAGNGPALHQALIATRPSPSNPVMCEEFLTGTEHSFETLTVGGKPRFFSVTQYRPTPLEVMENAWMQWSVLLPRELPGMESAIEVGLSAVQKLGLADGMTHMEWFRRPDGRVAVGEIAMRPPGAQFVELMTMAYDADMYRAWARAAIDGAYDGPHTQKYAAGIVYLRGSGTGRVAAVTGVRASQEKVGAYVVASQLPTIGAAKSSSYEGDGWVIVRHPNTEVVQQSMRTLLATIQVHYSS